MSFDEVYSMPVYLRTFYIKELIEQKKKEEKEMKKSQKKGKRPPSPRR